MKDMIERQAAIDTLMSEPPEMNYGFYYAEKIKKLPSAQPERKRGTWIEDAKTYYEQLNERGLRVDEYTPYFTDDIACSVCLAKYSMIDNETQFFKFCPNCGADMR